MRGKKFTHSNLLILLKLFQDRPKHLANFLLENDALNDSFIKKLNDSDRLIEISEGLNEKDIYFNSIDEMNRFYKLLIDDLETIKKRKTKAELIIELNQKIQDAISNEDYEEAARIRDYIIKNNLKKK
jgi:excinuclease UvrABC helicase subunit UvrB